MKRKVTIRRVAVLPVHVRADIVASGKRYLDEADKAVQAAAFLIAEARLLLLRTMPTKT